MKNAIGRIAGTAAAALLLGTALNAGAQELPRNVRLVIGSTSTGGDTYQNSAIVAEALSEKLGVNIKVDAVGPTEGFKALARDRRGSTLMMFHDQAYLGTIYGVRGYEPMFDTYRVGPTVAVNPGNAYLVAKDSEYESMEDVFAAASAGERVRVAIQPGGVSEIGFSAMKNAAKLLDPGSEENLVPLNTGSQADKDQALFDGQADVINGSIQANEQYTRLPDGDRKAMRFVWLTAGQGTIEQAEPEGLGETSREDMLAWVTPNVSVPLEEGEDFTFDKEFFFLYNRDMPEEIVARIDEALAEIFEEGTIQETQKRQFFIPNFRPSEEAEAHLREKNDAYVGVIESIRTE